MYLIALTSDEVTNRRLEQACGQCVTGKYGLPLAVLRGDPTDHEKMLRYKPERQVGDGVGWVLYQDTPIEDAEPEPSEVLECVKEVESEAS